MAHGKEDTAHINNFSDMTGKHSTATSLVKDLMSGLFRFLTINYCTVLLRNQGFLKNRCLTRNTLVIGYDHSFDPSAWHLLQKVLLSRFAEEKIPVENMQQEFVDMAIETMQFQPHDLPRKKNARQYAFFVQPMLLNEELIGIIALFDNNHQKLSTHEQIIVNFFIRQFILVLENKLLKEEIKLTSMIDTGSGLYSNAYFMDRLENEFKSARRFNTSFSILNAHVTVFDYIREQYGKETAADTLSYCAAEIKNQIRSIDIITLEGENELILLLPHTPSQGAMVLGNKLRKHLQNLSFTIANRSITLDIIFGVATVPDDEPDSALELLNCAKVSHAQAKEIEQKFASFEF